MTKPVVKGLVAIAFFVVLVAMAYAFQPAAAPDGSAVYWFSVIPPLVAILMSFATGLLFPSLLAAGFVGGLLVHLTLATPDERSLVGGLFYVPNVFLTNLTDSYNLQILFFVFAIMSTIELVVKAGGLAGVVKNLAPLCRGPYSTQFVTGLLGIALFIDDYGNTMIVGNSMRAVCDAHRVSREKLAFLVDSTSAPVAGVALVSTWVSYEIGLFRDLSESLQLGMNGFEMLLLALPFRFYCILLLIFLFGTVLLRRDFGPMATAERRAQELGKVLADDARPMAGDTEASMRVFTDARIVARTAVIPLLCLLAVLFGGIWYDGGGFARLPEQPLAFLSPTAWREVISASENATFFLASGSGVGFLAALCTAFAIAKLPSQPAASAVGRGVRTAVLPCCILLLAWTLKAVCDDLNTAGYMVALIGSNVPHHAFPALVFIVASVISFATGTSYGTMAIMLPIAIPVAHSMSGGAMDYVLIASLAAVLDGAIFGDHCSPISDTTIMSSLSSHCDHIHHVKTQMPYAIFVALVSLTGGYVFTGLGASHWLAIPVAIAMLLFGHVVLAKVWSGRPATA